MFPFQGRAACALEKTRGHDEEALRLVESYAVFSNEAGLSMARMCARLAGQEEEGGRRNYYVSKLRALSYLGQEVADLLEKCGDVVLQIVRKGDDFKSVLREIRAARLALVESSEYFAKLLSGVFSESNQSVITVQSDFPEHLERAIHYL